ncbi:hypothetical protein JX266_008407 [Neoarthrinium moseri]|nr:hypothetical protein JX266_008407 [Neoarthrinium moseri]
MSQASIWKRKRICSNFSKYCRESSGGDASLKILLTVSGIPAKLRQPNFSTAHGSPFGRDSPNNFAEAGLSLSPEYSMARKRSRRSRTDSAPTPKPAGCAPIGPPRLDKYSALLSRFYENLTILHAYDPVRGDHTREKREKGSKGFLTDLAFLCEYEKGGNACTGLGLQDFDGSFIYWVAANSDPKKKIAPFLKSVLDDLRGISHIPPDGREARQELLLIRCIEYAHRKVQQLRGLLLRNISECLSRVQNPGLAEWLQGFQQVSEHVALCKLAHELRKAHEVKQLELMAREPTYYRSPEDRKSPFLRVKHYIGRLSHYPRVVMRLIEELPLVEELVSFHIRVESIPVSKCAIPPPVDNLTTLNGICNRMVHDQTDPWLPELKIEFERYGMLQRILKSQEDPIVPRVHAEIQVLDFFYSQGLKWAYGNKFVGCSKSACFCCQLYFRYHPARPIELQSHRKIWLAWGPISLEMGANDPGFVQQREILQKIIHEIRKDILNQIQDRRGPHTWHEDTRTGITSSMHSEEDQSVHETTTAAKGLRAGRFTDKGSSTRSGNSKDTDQ